MGETERARGKLLLVDDDRAFAEALHAALTVAGYEVRDAFTGAEALEGAARARPDAILLDVRMPGLDGYEVCQILKRHPATQAIPVVFVTAVDDPALHRRACDAGGTACLMKPFSIERLTAVIEAVVATA
jgi:DNA-binding response OmpR family regulator